MIRYFILLICCCSGIVCDGQSLEKQLPPESPTIPFKATATPDRILMTVADSSAYSRRLTWRTDKSINTGKIQWSDQVTKIDFYKNPEEQDAFSRQFVTNIGDTVYYHTVTLPDLIPGHHYVYRVGEGRYYSEWLDFSIADTLTNDFEILYLGDAQNDVFPLWSRVFRKANERLPKAELILHAGDLINHSQNEYEWAEWFKAGGYLLASKPQVIAPGNHEYIKDDEGRKGSITPSFPLQFVQGIQDQSRPNGLPYFVDYKDCKILCLDSNKEIEEQAEWLQKTLENNSKKWTIVMFHHPIKSAKKGRVNKGIYQYWRPLLEHYKVDLVLQGHDHVYGRGQIPLNENGIGTTYVISMAGRKAYDVGQSDWLIKGAGNIQTYQRIKISDESIEFESWRMDDILVDSFRIVKENGFPRVIESGK